MNTPQQAVGAPAGRGRGRGGTVRGGGRGGGTPSVHVAGGGIAATGKIGPNRVLNAVWTEDSSLKGKSFVIFVGGGNTADHQITYHRPIGVTPLGANSWVATPTSEIDLLLQRRKSEALSRHEREKSAAIRAAVLAARTGRQLNEATPPKEVWVIEGSPLCAEGVQVAMAAAKAASRPESEWMTFAPAAVRQAEQRFKDAVALAAVPIEWARDHPEPAHVTRGGPLADREQLAVPFLDGLSLNQAKDMVLRLLFGFSDLVPRTRYVDGNEPVEEDAGGNPAT